MISDTDFFPAKAEIIRKLHEDSMRLRDQIRMECKKTPLSLAPAGTDFETGQLVKGEKFQDFPYVYLDFPKFFSRDEMFTFRSFFWWGHSLIFCWFLSGPRLDEYRKRLLACHKTISHQTVFLSTAGTPWEWGLEKPHAEFLDRIKKERLKEILAERTFLKFGCSMPLKFLETPDAILREGLRVFNFLKSIVE
ncbi:MAG TPA: hypothetical protein VNV63_00885 [Nitrospiria bacterium]|nr:hypothetical protein [Nitrospiria bacterium]